MNESGTVVRAPQSSIADGKDSNGQSKKKCSCGQIIIHVSSDSRPVSRRHHSAFNRQYRDRVTKELNHRKLAAKQVEDEARECAYLPLSNNVRRQMAETASLSSMVNRARRVLKARDDFHDGKICADCLTRVELSTGTHLLENMMNEEEVLSKPSDKEDCATFGGHQHVPREIIVSPQKDKAKSLVAGPSIDGEIQSDSRNDECAPRKSSLRSRAPTTGPLSFDMMGSPISSMESIDDVVLKISRKMPKPQTRDSSMETVTPRNTIQEIRQEEEAKKRQQGLPLCDSNYDGRGSYEESTMTGSTPLELVTYVEVPCLATSAKSVVSSAVPFDEKSNVSQLDVAKQPSSYMSLLASYSDANQSEPSGPTSSSPESMRSTSILDGEKGYRTDENEQVKEDVADAVEEEAVDTAYVGCELDPTEYDCMDESSDVEPLPPTADLGCMGCEMEQPKCKYVDSSDDDAPPSTGIVHPMTFGNHLDESHAQAQDFIKMKATDDRYAWLDEVTDCLLCDSIPIKMKTSSLPIGSIRSANTLDDRKEVDSRERADKNATPTPSDEVGTKPGSEQSEKSGSAASTGCETITLTPDVSHAVEEVKMAKKQDWLDQVTDCVTPNPSNDSIVEEEVSKRSPDHVDEGWIDNLTGRMTCGALD